MTQQFYHKFKGFGVHSSKCLVKIFYDDGDHFILFEDIGVGTSVTNASEQLANEIIKELNLDPEDCRFFETYSQYDYDSFDEITYTWVNGEATNASWKPTNHEIKVLFLS